MALKKVNVQEYTPDSKTFATRGWTIDDPVNGDVLGIIEVYTNDDYVVDVDNDMVRIRIS